MSYLPVWDALKSLRKGGDGPNFKELFVFGLRVEAVFIMQMEMATQKKQNRRRT